MTNLGHMKPAEHGGTTITGSQRQRSGGISEMMKSSLWISLFSLFGTVFGFLTQVILAATFGTTSQMDAYLVATTVPMMVTAIFAGSLNYTFVPLFVAKKNACQHELAWKTANNLLNLSAVVFGLLGLLGCLFSKFIVGSIAPGISEEERHLASLLLTIQMPSVAFSGLSALLSSIHYAEKRFIAPPVANLASSIVMFLSVYFLSHSVGVFAPAWGAIAGSFVTFVMLAPRVLRNLTYKASLDFKDEGTVTILKLMVPLLLGSIFYRADDLIQRYIASGFSEGSISYLGYSYKLITTLAGLVVAGLSVVFLTRISELSSSKDSQGVGDTFCKSFSWLTFFLVPVIMALIVYGKDIITVLFQRGKFDALSTANTWNCLVLYSGVLYGGAIGAIITPVFYAHQNTVTVVKIGVSGAVVQIVLAYVFSKIFSYPGLPFAYSLSSLFTISVFLLVLSKKYITVAFGALGRATSLVFCGGLVTGLFLWQVRESYLMSLNPIGRLTVLIPLGGILYLGVCALLRVDEARQLMQFALTLPYKRLLEKRD